MLLALISVYSCSLNESGKIRRTVQLGIEKIRAVDQRHGLQAQLLIYLANAFGSKVRGSVIMVLVFVII